MPFLTTSGAGSARGQGFRTLTKKLVTVTFNSSTTWTIPDGVGRLASATGRGEDGYPPEDVYVEQYQEYYTVHNVPRSGGAEQVSGPYAGSSGSGPAPSPYCESPTPLPGNPTFSETYSCYTFNDTSYYDTNPGYTGQDTTAFGVSFPGGAETTASTLAYSSVSVTPNQSYSIYIAPGGFLTITYWK